MKETNTFNETYVGHLEGEDLQRVRCETRRLQESVKKEEKDNGSGAAGDTAYILNRREVIRVHKHHNSLPHPA